jgi:hypothetical protein
MVDCCKSFMDCIVKIHGRLTKHLQGAIVKISKIGLVSERSFPCNPIFLLQYTENHGHCRQRIVAVVFMHTGVQMKYVSKLTDARRTSR